MDWDRIQRLNRSRRYDIFVSYSHADADIARGLQEMLISEGYVVWRDSALRAGDQFPAEIERAIERCRWVVCLWSKTAAASDWVRREVRLGRIHGRVIPFTLDDCVLPEEFADLHAVKFSDWPSCMKEIFRATVDRQEREQCQQQSFMQHRYGNAKDAVTREIEQWTNDLPPKDKAEKK